MTPSPYCLFDKLFSQYSSAGSQVCCRCLLGGRVVEMARNAKLYPRFPIERSSEWGGDALLSRGFAIIGKYLSGSLWKRLSSLRCRFGNRGMIARTPMRTNFGALFSGRLFGLIPLALLKVADQPFSCCSLPTNWLRNLSWAILGKTCLINLKNWD